MGVLQAVRYFLREACLNLVRSWKVSLVAVTTSGVSLFVGGVFLLLSDNMAGVLHRWQSETRVILYLDGAATAADRREIERRVGQGAWVRGVERVTAEQAGERFSELFPSLSDLVGGQGHEPLPASIEIAYDPRDLDPASFAAWLRSLRGAPGVAMVDDDQDWLDQLEGLVVLVRGIGLTLGAILLAAAVFTVASLIRLTAYLYEEEIAIMRLVGATEFFIRGPFYAEGFIQGTLGGALAMACLYGAFAGVATRVSSSLAGAVLTSRFLTPVQLLLMVGLGGTAGLVGAIFSLRRENLGRIEE